MPRSKLVARIAGVSVAVMAMFSVMMGSPNAEASGYNISGTLNTGGYLVQYSTYRTHTGGGASLQVTLNVDTYSRFGLRNPSGTQITNSNEYHAKEYLAFTMASNGSLVIPAGSYAINGRMAAKSGAANSWRGYLTI